MKWSWLLGAVAVAGFLLVRRHRLGRWTQAAGWVVVAGAGAVGVGLVQLPNLEELFLDVGRALGPWTYLVVGILAFLETGAFIGLVAPGETTVIVGGVIAGQGEISLLVLIGIVWACAVAGDLASYTAGRKLGRAWLLRHGERAEDHRGPAAQGGGVLRQARRPDDPRRALHRLRPRPGAVHRRHLEHAAAQVPAVRRARRGRVGRHLLHARLRLLAVVRPADELRVARPVRVRHRRRRRRGDRVPRPGPARSRAARAGASVARGAPGPARLAAGRAVRRPGVADVRPPGGDGGRPHRPLRLEPAHAREPRARADDAARPAGGGRLHVLRLRRHRRRRGGAPHRPRRGRRRGGPVRSLARRRRARGDVARCAPRGRRRGAPHRALVRDHRPAGATPWRSSPASRSATSSST